MSKKKEAKAHNERVRRDLRAMAALDRAEVLSRPGNNAMIWISAGIRGGAEKDRRKEANRRACRDWR